MFQSGRTNRCSISDDIEFDVQNAICIVTGRPEGNKCTGIQATGGAGKMNAPTRCRSRSAQMIYYACTGPANGRRSRKRTDGNSANIFHVMSRSGKDVKFAIITLQLISTDRAKKWCENSINCTEIALRALLAHKHIHAPHFPEMTFQLIPPHFK